MTLLKPTPYVIVPRKAQHSERGELFVGKSPSTIEGGIGLDLFARFSKHTKPCEGLSRSSYNAK